ncbi:MAG: diadenylate cyclase [Deltaproteobacteria bacterium]|nr:diadenylate cyclase [Deltaproteobacteria bacterium]
MSQNLINTIRWQDVLDILLISYILFRLYVLFKGTNVFRVLIGIAILWFCQKIAYSMGLIVTSWAVQAFTAVAPIIIIVIFRNEIRTVLQAKNFKALFWDAPHYDLETPVDIISESIFEMASKGTGAIMVIPGKEDISESVHSGVKWDGKITKEMILSIFWHENPVHDGAAVIIGDRITQVGAVLPLSHRKDMPSYYGMRHRAAAGLSEATDAMVILSSEERRNVIVAKAGNISIINNRKELCSYINSHLEIPEEKSTDKRKQNIELATAAIVSLVFITGIWLSFTRGIDTYITLDVPVEYTNSNPAEIIVAETPVKKVSLDLSGSGRLLKNLVPGQVKVGIDLGTGEIGRNVYNITSENITMPPGVFIRNTTPSSVDIILDKLARKNVPVQADWKGTLADDILISGVSFQPDMAVISGPSLILNDISTVYTEKIPLENIRQSGKMDVNLDLSNKVKIENSINGKFTMEYLVIKKETLDAVY